MVGSIFLFDVECIFTLPESFELGFWTPFSMVNLYGKNCTTAISQGKMYNYQF